MTFVVAPGGPVTPDKFVVRDANNNVVRLSDGAPITFDNAEEAAIAAAQLNDRETPQC